MIISAVGKDIMEYVVAAIVQMYYVQKGQYIKLWFQTDAVVINSNI